LQVGGTPLVKARPARQALGVEKVWVKNDARQLPTLSFKGPRRRRGLVEGQRFGLTTVGCASTATWRTRRR